jgi:hypothetical protein
VRHLLIPFRRWVVIPDSSGGFYLGGNFTTVGGLARGGLAHITSNKQVGSWNPVANDIVSCMAINEGILYVGGYFTSLDGQIRNRLASFNIADGTLTSWDPNMNNAVFTIKISDNTIYTGGSFTLAGAQIRNRLAAFDLSEGTLSSWNPDANADVNSIAIHGSSVYTGGVFTTVGGQSRNYLAEINATDGIASAWNPNSNHYITSLAYSDSVVYAGGLFSNIGGQSRTYLAAISASDGTATSWNPNCNGSITAIIPHGNKVYLSGYFNTVGGQSRNRLACLSTVDALADAWYSHTNNDVRSLALYNDLVYVGGLFSSIGGTERNRLAAIDVNTGLVTSFNPNANNTVNTLILNAGKLYAGGSFTNIGGQSKYYLAAISTSTGIADSWNPNPNSTVTSIAIYGNTLYACGSFSSIGGLTRPRIAAIDLSSGAATSSIMKKSMGTPTKLLISGSTLYVCGDFTNIMGSSRGRIASFSLPSFSINSFNPNANGTVYSMVINGTTLYVSGSFSSVGGLSRSGIAAINTSSGTVASWDPSPNNSVTALACSGDLVFAGGQFTSIGGQSRNYVAALRASDGTATSWNPGFNNTIGTNAMMVEGGTLFIGGSFTSIGSNSAYRGFTSFALSTVIKTEPENKNICEGDSASFSLGVENAASYEWQVSIDSGSTWAVASGGIYSGETTGTLTLATPGTSYSGYKFRCIIGSSCFLSDTSNTVSLNVNSIPDLSITPESLEFCGGGSVAISSVSNASNATYLWSNGSSESSLTVSSGGTYSLRVTDGTTACSYTDSVSITENPSPTVSLPTIADICRLSSSIILNGGSPSGGSYRGDGVSYIAAEYSFSPSAAGTGTHSITYTYTNGCADSASIDLNVLACETTNLMDEFCGDTLSGIGSEIKVYSLPGATNYEYTFMNQAGGPDIIKLRNDTSSSLILNHVSGLLFGNVYDVKVRAYIEDDWKAFGGICTITMPEALAKIKPMYCGTSVDLATDLIYAEKVARATAYEFKLTSTRTETVLNMLQNSTNPVFKFSYVNFYPGDEYNVQVRAYADNSWGPFGAVCQINAPSVHIISPSCGSTLASLADVIKINAVPGATNYSYELTDLSDSTVLTYERGANSTIFYIRNVVGIEFDKTYSIRVRAYISDGWTPYGSVCSITTPGPSKLKPVHCGSSVNLASDLIYGVSVGGATAYEFKLTSRSTSSILSKVQSSVSPVFKFSYVNYMAGDVYDVQVRALIGGIWSSFGPSCQLTAPKSHIISPACGSTLGQFSDIILINPVPDATNYRYELTDLSDSSVLNYVRGANSGSLYLTNIAGIKYNTTYQIKVSAYIGSSWTSYGNACEITSPLPALTSLTSDYCDKAVASINSYIYANGIFKASNYEFEFTDVLSSVVKTKQNGGSQRSIKLGSVSGLLAGNTYNVRVRSYVEGAWTAYGNSCQLSIPSFARLGSNDSSDMAEEGGIAADSFQIFPNPFSNEFRISINASNDEETELCIYDVSGRIIETHRFTSAQAEISFGKELGRGVYLLGYKQGQNAKMIRIVKMD